MTDRLFMLRYKNDGVVIDHANRFHRDNYFIMGVVISGLHKLSIDFEEYELHDGNAIIILPGQIHASTPDNGVNGFALVIAPELLSESDLFAVSELQLKNRIIKLSYDDLHDVLSLYYILKRRNETYGEIELTLVNAIKSIIIGNIKSEKLSFAGRYMRIYIKFQQLMEKNICAIKSPSEYASMLNVSGVYLNEAVKSVTGKSTSNIIGEYITLLAKRELVYSQLSAQEIAYSIGYEDYSYFSRLFRRHAGISPKAFRDLYLE